MMELQKIPILWILMQKKKKRKLKIIDTAGHSDFQNNLDTWISQGDCFLLIYSINDINSFEQVNTIYKKICQIKEEKEENVIANLIGNKCDLPTNERKVLTNEAEEYAKNNNMDYLDSSAFNGYNVKEAFYGITMKYLEINGDDSEEIFVIIVFNNIYMKISNFEFELQL